MPVSPSNQWSEVDGREPISILGAHVISVGGVPYWSDDPYATDDGLLYMVGDDVVLDWD